MHIKNYLFFFNCFNYGKNNLNNDFILKSNYLLVFKEYNIKISLSDFINKKSEGLKDLFLYIFFLKERIPYQLMKSLIDNKYYVLYKEKKINEKKNNIEILENLNNFLMENINYQGYDEFVKIIDNISDNNEYLQYKICVLNNIPDDYDSINMDKLIEDNCIFAFTTYEKKILKNCPKCTKKEVNVCLNSIDVGEKKLIYLKSHGRYVILERLENIPFEKELDDESLKSSYIHYGFSLYYDNLNNKNIFKEKILNFVHEVYCH
jgi:hypothetical protein